MVWRRSSGPAQSHRSARARQVRLAGHDRQGVSLAADRAYRKTARRAGRTGADPGRTAVAGVRRLRPREAGFEEDGRTTCTPIGAIEHLIAPG